MTYRNPRSQAGKPQILEIVRVRCSTASVTGAEASLAGLLRSSGRHDVCCFRNAATPEDLGVHVSAAADSSPSESASPLGLRIARALRDFGQVSHHVWIPLNDSPQPEEEK